jgi:copper chaperone
MNPHHEHRKALMTTTTYAVTGMSCEHCVNAVTTELGSLDGVSAVSVDLVADGSSRVTVASDRPLSEEEVIAALDEAGGYQISGS